MRDFPHFPTTGTKALEDAAAKAAAEAVAAEAVATRKAAEDTAAAKAVEAADARAWAPALRRQRLHAWPATAALQPNHQPELKVEDPQLERRLARSRSGKRACSQPAAADSPREDEVTPRHTVDRRRLSLMACCSRNLRSTATTYYKD